MELVVSLVDLQIVSVYASEAKFNTHPVSFVLQDLEVCVTVEVPVFFINLCFGLAAGDIAVDAEMGLTSGFSCPSAWRRGVVENARMKRPKSLDLDRSRLEDEHEPSLDNNIIVLMIWMKDKR